MAEKLCRAQIMLEKRQHEALAEEAKQEGKSISELVRGIVETHLEGRRQEEIQKRLAGLERVRQLREKILERRGGRPLDIDFTEVINEIREERTRELYEMGFERRD